MGKSSSTSSSSCFKLIPCGTSNTGASSDNDDFNHPPPTTTQTTKASSDKRGWSFRKKSGRHRVLGSNVTSESSTFADKEVSLPLVVKTEFQEPVKSTSANEKPPLDEPAEKDSALEYDGVSKKSSEVIASENYSEKPKLGQVMVASDNDSNSTSTEVDDTVVLENGSFEPTIELTIDTESLDLKSENNELDKPETNELEKPEALNSVGASEDVSNVSVLVDEPVAIVLQSSIRGFMAQQEYLQLKNVVMLQAVIRGHLVRRNAVESLHCIRSIAKVQALVRAHSGKALDQNNKKSEGQFSTENLLKNSFARQLLESTPKPKSVNIRCDPLSPNSAWIWLERWMSMSVSSEVSPKVEPSSSTDLQNDNQVQSYDPQNEDEKSKSSMSLTDSLVSKAIVDETPKSSESEENHCFNVVDHVEIQSSQPIFTENHQSHNQSTEEINEDMNSSKMDNFVSQEELISNSDEVTADIPHPKLSAKQVESEELTGEETKLSSESRKDSNPAEIVAHSDFEGLSSAAESGKSINSSDTKVEADTSSTLVEIETPSKPSEPSVLGVDPQNLFAVSECGTELSVTSTLDSPDRSELEIPQPEPQVQIFGIDESKEGEDCEIDGKINQEEVQETTGNVSVSPAVSEVIPQMEQKIEMKASDEPKNFTCTDENSAGIKPKEDLNEQLKEEKLSPQASPRSSHITVAESQGTPSSQVSVNKDKRNKSGKSGSIPKPSSRSAGKKSPSTPNLKSPSTPIMDSGGGRSSVEHLPKDHKSSGKRRNSFGSTKSDTPDQESRDSNSNTLPSYMQATKSAKAKVHSPKSSPDFHDKEITPKKRQSFPGAGGRQQVSPRVQGSTSDAPQGGGAKPTSSERKWQR